ncbi:hypothetical protein [Xylophilus sp. ASV27]|uniref:hypothetical protein n=1 Tax=Xylophilus sp. ASV27 TaxID=2795129 RepID=UPI0018ECE303|nr:hypothetical protein [Xylophilus sp. ASV27]
MRRIALFMMAAVLTACAMPETSVRTGSPRPAIFVKGAPEGATLFVDGLAMGAASQFNGTPQTLRVEEGVHLVEVRSGNAVLHSEKLFVSNGESRGVTVSGGAR